MQFPQGSQTVSGGHGNIHANRHCSRTTSDKARIDNPSEIHLTLSSSAPRAKSVSARVVIGQRMMGRIIILETPFVGLAVGASGVDALSSSGAFRRQIKSCLIRAHAR